MDNDTTEFQMTATVQPGSSGALLGVTAECMNDVAAIMATNSVPQTVNFGIKGDVAGNCLRLNGVELKTSGEAAALTTPQVICVCAKDSTAPACLLLKADHLPH